MPGHRHRRGRGHPPRGPRTTSHPRRPAPPAARSRPSGPARTPRAWRGPRARLGRGGVARAGCRRLDRPHRRRPPRPIWRARPARALPAPGPDHPARCQARCPGVPPWPRHRAAPARFPAPRGRRGHPQPASQDRARRTQGLRLPGPARRRPARSRRPGPGLTPPVLSRPAVPVRGRIRRPVRGTLAPRGIRAPARGLLPARSRRPGPTGAGRARQPGSNPPSSSPSRHTPGHRSPATHPRRRRIRCPARRARVGLDPGRSRHRQARPFRTRVLRPPPHPPLPGRAHPYQLPLPYQVLACQEPRCQDRRCQDLPCPVPR